MYFSGQPISGQDSQDDFYESIFIFVHNPIGVISLYKNLKMQSRTP